MDFRSDRQPNLSLHQVTDLFVGVGVKGEDGPFLQPELHHQRLVAVHQSLLFYSIQWPPVAFIALFFKHLCPRVFANLPL